jgi:hypothetical protein
MVPSENPWFIALFRKIPAESKKALKQPKVVFQAIPIIRPTKIIYIYLFEINGL